jgi:hypothetical protein
MGGSLGALVRAGPVWGPGSIPEAPAARQTPPAVGRLTGFPVIQIGVPGFEPGTSCSQSRRATGLRHTPSLPANNLDDRDRLANPCAHVSVHVSVHVGDWRSCLPRLAQTARHSSQPSASFPRPHGGINVAAPTFLILRADSYDLRDRRNTRAIDQEEHVRSRRRQGAPGRGHGPKTRGASRLHGQSKDELALVEPVGDGGQPDEGASADGSRIRRLDRERLPVCEARWRRGDARPHGEGAIAV